MASNRTRRSARNTKTGSNVVGIQKKINTDYETLFRDYKKLTREVLEIPATRYILGGVAIVSLIPFAMRLFRRYPEINTFVSDNLDSVVSKVDGIIGSRKGDEASLNH